MKITGTLTKGKGRASRIGFPTINLNYGGKGKNNLRQGVYAGEAKIGRKKYPCVIHYGNSPTFGDRERKFEVHLIGWGRKPLVLGKKTVEVEVRTYIRPVKKFSNEDELKKQIEKDIRQARLITHLP